MTLGAVTIPAIFVALPFVVENGVFRAPSRRCRDFLPAASGPGKATDSKLPAAPGHLPVTGTNLA
ncbi:hypothetical protein TUSST3_05330 [Streptomyces sp. TUS-ST3]|nr:hypothetical protein TUSST3_05330 [Streptomyces sp. TUS-ST3]